MKKALLFILLSVFIISCNKRFDEAMKSADKDLILKVANESFAKKKWKDALALYERSLNLIAGTDDLVDVTFNMAYAEYYEKNYKLAGHHFKRFANTFPQDPRREEAAYMSALCYYKGSMDYNLDQSSTELAINELQDFLNSYPNSERGRNINELIDELSYKLEIKAYENARQYFKMAEYKAANVSFENVLNDFPATKLRPQIFDYMMKSKSELAINSNFELKKDRLASAIAFTRQLEKEYPNTESAKNAVQLRDKLIKEQEKFAQEEILYQKQKAEYEQKLKAAEATELQNSQLKKQRKDEIEAEKTLIDSAKLETPKPAATFKIRR